MEIERRHAPVPAELMEYLRANPVPPGTDGQQVHVHVHHHYAPAEPIPADRIVHQGARPSVAEKVIPWLWVSLIACVVLTLCAAVFAMVMVITMVVLAALVLLGLVVAYIINAQAGVIEARGKEAAMLKDSKRR